MKPITITSPVPGMGAQIFTGNAAGTYSPPQSNLSLVAINCSFWSGPNTAGPPTSNATATADTTGGWNVSFNKATLPSITNYNGVLQATLTLAGTLVGTASVGNLTWYPPPPPPTLATAAKSKAAKAAVSPPPPPPAPTPVTINSPADCDTISRGFLLYGDYTPDTGNTVSVALFRDDGNQALTTILPTATVAPGKWVTAVYSLDSGVHYAILATLRKSSGEVITGYSIGNIRVLG